MNTITATELTEEQYELSFGMPEYCPKCGAELSEWMSNIIACDNLDCDWHEEL